MASENYGKVVRAGDLQHPDPMALAQFYRKLASAARSALEIHIKCHEDKPRLLKREGYYEIMDRLEQMAGEEPGIMEQARFDFELGVSGSESLGVDVEGLLAALASDGVKPGAIVEIAGVGKGDRVLMEEFDVLRGAPDTESPVEPDDEDQQIAGEDPSDAEAQSGGEGEQD